MMNWIIGFSLKNKLFVVIAALLVSWYGLYTALRMPIDVLPDLNKPTVVIMAEAHAMVPEDVERLVTRPLEQVLNGATGVSGVRSSSGLGLCAIQVEFGWQTDVYRNRQIVQEKLQLAQEKLPPGVSVQMTPVSSIMGQIHLIGLASHSGNTDVSALRAMVDQTIKPRLMSVAGVAQIVTSGGSPRQLQVTVDVERLPVFDVTLEEVAEAVEKANVNASGGFLTIGSKSPVITVTGRILSEDEIASAVVKADPVRPVRVDDVADVKFGPAAIRTGEAGINGKPGVIMVIFKQPAVDTVDLTDRINHELSEIQKTLPQDIVIIDDVFQQAAFIHRAIDNVLDAVRDGSILVVVILFLFLMNIRTTFITLTAIPLSVAITAIVFALFGLSINTMTLGGLAVAVGALVDDAIVYVENAYRRLRQNATSPQPHKPLWVVFLACSEVRQPVLVGTLLVVVVYLPLFYLTGLEGRLFTPIGIAYIVSVMASLLVSMTVTPALCAFLLGRSTTARQSEDAWLVRHLKRAAGAVIRFSMARAAAIMGAMAVLVLIGILLLLNCGTQFLPAFNEGVAQINLILPPETGLDTSDAYGKRLEKVLVEVPGVKNVGRRTGRAEGDEHAEGVNMSEAIVTIDPKAARTREEVIEDVRERLEVEFPGVATAVDQPLAHLLSSLLSGVNAQVAIKIMGPDLDVLRGTAEEVKTAIATVPGVKDLYIQPLVLVDQIAVEPKRARLAQWGLTAQDVANVIELSGGGEEVSRMNVGQTSYPIVVQLNGKNRRSLEDLRNLQLRTAEGGRVLLSDVADVRITKTPNNINRENVSRRAVVQHNVAGRSLGEVVRDVDRALEPIRQRLGRLPGYSIRISGQFEAQAEATRAIMVMSLIALGAMFLILYIHFRSVNLAAQVLLSIPMAFVGAIAYIVISGQTISIATLVGLISLGGIAARNAILLFDHYLHLMREEEVPFSQAMIVRAGQERMVPVLMTALCAGIALIPLALAPDEPGREILYPVATVIIGGLISSTILDFLARPGIFWLFSRREAERLTRKHEHLDPLSEEIVADFDRPANGSAVRRPAV